MPDDQVKFRSLLGLAQVGVLRGVMGADTFDSDNHVPFFKPVDPNHHPAQ